MSSYLKHREDTRLSVPEAVTTDGVTYYRVNVKVGSVEWSVLRRFSDFADLHERLATEHGLARDKLPPKKIIGNKTSKFIEQRREALDQYLSGALNYLRLATPTVFARFLDMHKYDIFFLLQAVAEKLYTNGDKILQSGIPYKCTPLELHAISERLKMPCPPTEKQDQTYDFSHILDFCGQVRSLHLEGSYEKVGSSNIIPNCLQFDLVCFKSLQDLTILGVPMPCIQSVGGLRDTLRTVSVLVAGVVSLNEFLLVDILHKEPASVADTVKWKSLTTINFGSNKIEQIDWAVRLVPKLQKLSLPSNNLSVMSDISTLHHLTSIDLSMNGFAACDNWHSKMGNVRSIDLSQNKVESLKGFARMYSLESLNLSCNLISDVEEVQHICRLPCLENLWLTANPVASGVDYRVRVLEQFDARAADVCLDNERASERELDTARVLHALRIVREGKTPGFMSSNNSSISFNRQLVCGEIDERP